MCSTRTKHLRIDPALIPLMGSLHRKQKFPTRETPKGPRSNLEDERQRGERVLEDHTLEDTKIGRAHV